MNWYSTILCFAFMNAVRPDVLLRRQSDILQHAIAFERAVPTAHTFTTTFLPAYFSYYVMAVLVQLPHTRLYRAALLPVVLWTTFRANMSLDFSWNLAGYAYMNQGLAVGANVSLEMHRLIIYNLAWHVYNRNAEHSMGVRKATFH